MAHQLFEQYEKELKEFQDIIKSKPHWPQNMDKLLLLRFLKVYDFDVEKAKQLLQLNLQMRKKNPNLFKTRDVLGDEFQRTFKIVQICPMPKTTKENYKISCFRLRDTDPNNYNCLDVCRMVVTVLDAAFVTRDENDLVDGEISIVDLQGYGMKHFVKSAASLSLMKNYTKYVQEAAPLKIVQSHFINCPPVFINFFSLIKSFITKEVLETIKFHSSIESLLDVIPRELLPPEYGGTALRLDELNGDWIKLVERKRDYLLNDDNWKLGD